MLSYVCLIVLFYWTIIVEFTQHTKLGISNVVSVVITVPETLSKYLGRFKELLDYYFLNDQNLMSTKCHKISAIYLVDGACRIVEKHATNSSWKVCQALCETINYALEFTVDGFIRYIKYQQAIVWFISTQHR